MEQEHCKWMNTFTNDANACSVVSVHPNKDAFAVVLEINLVAKYYCDVLHPFKWVPTSVLGPYF